MGGRSALNDRAWWKANRPKSPDLFLDEFAAVTGAARMLGLPPLTQDIALPGLRLHPLKGDQAGRWAVSVSGNPPHSPEILAEECLKPLGLSVTAAAQ